MTTKNFTVKNGLTTGNIVLDAASSNATVGNLIGPQANGNSNVNIPAANGNINLTVGGNANILVVTGTGVNVAGTLNTGTGNITSGNANLGNLVIANYYQGTLTTAAQPNITSVGTLVNLTVTSSVAATPVTVTYTPATSAGSSLLLQGGNTQGGTGFFDFIKITNQSGSSNISKSFRMSPGGDIQIINSAYNTNIFDLTDSGNVTIPGNISAAYHIGNGSALSSITGTNVTGTVANATYATTAGSATTAGTVTTNAQPNITSVGTLTSLAVTGNITANYFIGNGSQLTGLSTSSLANGNSNVNIPTANGNINLTAGGNVTLVVTSTGANVAGYANITGALTVGANITSGSGTGGNITGANLVSANYFTGTLTTAAQPNITSVGTLTSLTVNGLITALTSATTTGTTITPTAGSTNQYNVTALASAATIATPSGTPVDGQKLTLRFKDNGTARALTWTTTSGAYRAVGVTLPATTVISKVLYVGCIYNSQDTFWDVVAVAQQ